MQLSQKVKLVHCNRPPLFWKFQAFINLCLHHEFGLSWPEAVYGPNTRRHIDELVEMVMGRSHIEEGR